MRRRLLVSVPLVAALLLPHPAQAQFGKIKKKVAEQVTGKKPDTTAATAAAGPKCDKSSMVIDAGVVDRYLRGLKARDVELEKVARQPGPIGQYYAAVARRREVEQRKREYDLRRGPDWERYKIIYPKMVHGDQAALQANQALMDSLDPGKVEVPTLDWTAQQQNNAHLDSVMVAASGISACDWGGNGIGDRMPALVNILYNDPGARDFRGYGTPAEGAAVKARLSELTAALGYSRGTSEPTAGEKAHIKEEDEKLALAGAATGDAYTDCMTRATQDFVKKHQAELEKAGKEKDMAAAMRLTQLQVQEGDKACSKYQHDQ